MACNLAFSGEEMGKIGNQQANEKDENGAVLLNRIDSLSKNDNQDVQIELEHTETDLDSSKRGKSNGSFSWENITYEVGSHCRPWKGKKRLLSGIFGHVTEGEVHALMGPSGCGKTTLLDVLAHRVNFADYQGRLLINGDCVDEQVCMCKHNFTHNF